MNVLLFGITKDIVGLPVVRLKFEQALSVRDLKATIMESYPELRNLSSLRIAVNNHYAEEDQMINSNDQIALIPPVSGG